MSRQFFSGNSIEQAVMAAARHYGVEPEKIAYSTRDKKHGFLNIRRRVVIEVDPEKPELTEDELASRSRSTAPGPSSKPKIIDVPEEVTAEERENLAGHVEDEEEDDTAGYDDADDSERDSDDVDYDDGDDESDGESDDEESDGDDDEYADEDDADDESDEDDADDDRRRDQGRGGRGRGGRSAGGRGRQGGKKPRDGKGRGGDRRPRRTDRDDDENVRMYRGVQVDWKEEVELEGVSRELAAFEFAVEQTLDVMDLEIEYTIVEGDTFKIEFSGEDADLLTEDDGRVLKAFEHVLPRIVRGLVGETHNCKVDCEGFRAEHEDQLVEMAQDAADEVRESGDPKVLPQMNPSDRRIIHLALVNDPDVETISQGRGYMKRVRIQLLEDED